MGHDSVFNRQRFEIVEGALKLEGKEKESERVHAGWRADRQN